MRKSHTILMAFASMMAAAQGRREESRKPKGLVMARGNLGFGMDNSSGFFSPTRSQRVKNKLNRKYYSR